MDGHAILPIAQMLGLAGSASLLSGWRLYLVVFATGIAMHTGVIPLPEHLSGLQVLANPWVIGASAFAALCEFLADKIALVDSLWDAVHTVIRPLGGALVSLALVDPSDGATQAIVFLLGGGGALLAHGGKAGVRALVNTSPEPVSNVVVSTTEDVVTSGLLVLVYHYPLTAGFVAAVLLASAIALLIMARRVLRRLFGRRVRRAD